MAGTPARPWRPRTHVCALDTGGWKMAPVSKPRGSSFEDAKMRYVDVVEAMKLGTCTMFKPAPAVYWP